MSPRAARDEPARGLLIKEVFSEASEAEPEQRDAIVDTRCGAAGELRLQAQWLAEAYLATRRGYNLQGRAH